MKKKFLYIFSTLFLMSFQSYSAVLEDEVSYEIYERALRNYENAYDVMTNESDRITRRGLNSEFIVDNSEGNEEDTLRKVEVYVRGEREDYRQALIGIYTNCSGEAGKLDDLIKEANDPDTRDEVSRARSLYNLCARQAAHELDTFF